MSYKPRSLHSLINEINKTIFLPHIQRPFVWSNDQIFNLFDSIMRNYPIQTFLFWKTDEEIRARRFLQLLPDSNDINLSDLYDPAISAKNIEKVFVLDGQQRLQSLYTIFKGGFEQESGAPKYCLFDVLSDPAAEGVAYKIKFSMDSEGPSWYRVSDLFGKDHQKNSEDITEEIIEGMIEANQFSGERPERETEKLIRKNISKLVAVLREEIHFWIQELDGIANKISYEDILAIFIRVNSGGTKLDAADLMFAAMKESWSEIELVLEQIVDQVNTHADIGFDKEIALRCIFSSYGKEFNLKKLRHEEDKEITERIKLDWSDIADAFKKMADLFYSDIKVTKRAIKSHNSIIPIYDYIFNSKKFTPKDCHLISAYFYKSQMFGWYSSGTDSTVAFLHGILEKDTELGFPLTKIIAYFTSKGKEISLSKLDLSDAPKRQLILNIIYTKTFGVSPYKILHKDNVPQVDHIFPQSPLRSRLKMPSYSVNRIGNLRFLIAGENRRKRAELPKEYFSRLKLENIDIKNHLLVEKYSQDPGLLDFTHQAYEEFIRLREEEIWNIANKVVNYEKKTEKINA
jgi:hypothetical protein